LFFQLLLYQRPQFCRIEPTLLGFQEDLLQSRADQVHALLATAPASVGGHGQAGAANGGQHIVVLQLAIGSGDRVRIDRQFAGQLANRGNQFAFLEHLAGHGELDLANDLIVDGQPVIEVDLKEHTGVLCASDIVQYRKIGRFVKRIFGKFFWAGNQLAGTGKQQAKKPRRRGVCIRAATVECTSMDVISAETVTRLWDTHCASLVLYARQWCDTPEDVVQEAFLLLVRQGVAIDNPVGWLYRVVRNRAINAGRSRGRRSRREAAVATHGEPWFETAEGDRLDSVAATDALQQLPADEREAIIARLWGGLSFDEIARLSGTSLSSAYRCYQRGLAALQERLGGSCRTKKIATKTKI
jgi:RNA polymerase sigma factor (sigma-70 family)